MKNINLLFIDAKDFLSNEVNRVFLAVIIIGLTLCYMVYDEKTAILQSNETLLKAIKKAEKKVDFRYFNTTKSLEKIHHVEIDTKTGELKR